VAVTVHYYPSYGVSLLAKAASGTADTLQVALMASGTYTWNAQSTGHQRVSDFLAGSGAGAITEVSTGGTNYTRKTLATVYTSNSSYYYSFEGLSTQNWVNTANTTLSATSAQAHAGTASLQMSSIASGTMSTANGVAQGQMAVSPGGAVSASAWFRTAVSARSCFVGVNWYDSSGTLLSNSPGGTITDATSAWTQSTVSATAPASSAWAHVNATVLATGGASEVHYVDDVYINTGTPNDYTTLVITTNPSWSAATFSTNYAVFFDNSIGGTDATNQVICYWDFGGTQVVTAGTPFTLFLGSLNGVNQALVQWISS
jgi:hypothetical protein